MNLKARDVKRAVSGGGLIRIKFDRAQEEDVKAIVTGALVGMQRPTKIKFMDNRTAGKRVARIHYENGDYEEIRKRLENRGVSFER